MIEFIESLAGQETALVWLQMYVPLLVKSGLILGAAGIVTHVLRNSAAALRHLVWVAAVVGILVLPVLGGLMPKIAVPALPSVAESSAAAAPVSASRMVYRSSDAPVSSRATASRSTRVATGGSSLAGPSTAGAGDEVSASGLAAVAANLRAVPWTVWVFVTWLAGTLFLLSRLLFSHISAWALVRGSHIVHDDAWHLALESHSRRMGINRRVRLRKCDWLDVPVTVGSIRPAIVLPEEASDWDDETRDAVMLHELAHVRRLDCLSQTMVETVRALFWVNPLSWMAESAMRVERERACDDLVITSGTRASTYAQTLLELAGSIRGRDRTSAAMMAMARRSDLEGRLLDILDSGPRLRNVNRVGAALAIAIVLSVVMPVAALTPASDGQLEPLAALAEPVEPVVFEIAEPPAIAETGIATSAVSAAQLAAAMAQIEANGIAKGFVDEVMIDVAEAMEQVEIELAEAGIMFESGAISFATAPAQGDTLTIDQIIELAKHGVDADYIEELRQMGYADLSFETLMSFARHGVDAELVRSLESLGYGGASADRVVSLVRHGIDEDDIAEYAAIGYTGLSLEELVELARHGVDADDMSEFIDAGLAGLGAKDYVQLARHGVDAELAVALRESGYADVTVERIVDLSRHGLEAECVAAYNEAGFGRFSLDALLTFERRGVDADFLEELAREGLTDLTVEQIVKLNDHGISADYIKKVTGKGNK